VVVLGVALGLTMSGFLTGCEASPVDDTEVTEVSESPSGQGTVPLPELPPVDLLAPTTFETASFALG